MAREGEPVMTALADIVIALLAAVTIVMFIAVISANGLVPVEVHREDRDMTLTGTAPGRLALLSRVVLGVPNVRMDSGIAPEDSPAWFERTTGVGMR